MVQQVQPQLHDDSIKKEQIDHPLVAQQVCMMLLFDVFCLANFYCKKNYKIGTYKKFTVMQSSRKEGVYDASF